jgi:hypothetical protein
MDRCQAQLTYRLSVRAEARAWRWTVLHGDTLAMQGEAPTVDNALRVGDLAAGLHAAFRRIGQRRF